MMRLGVNIDHVATLRNARGGREPEPLTAAGIVKQAGADSVVMHLREDRRHIRDEDVYAVKDQIDIKLNLEMSLNREIVKQALKIAPFQATLVPEKREELTTEGGLDVAADLSRIKETVQALREKGVTVSLFIDPDKKQAEKALEAGAGMIEIHTGMYAELYRKNKYHAALRRIADTARFGRENGLAVAAGHGLTFQNVPLIAAVPEIEEFNIGHSIISAALFTGLLDAVRFMRRVIMDSRGAGREI